MKSERLCLRLKSAEFRRLRIVARESGFASAGAMVRAMVGSFLRRCDEAADTTPREVTVAEWLDTLGEAEGPPMAGWQRRDLNLRQS